MNNNIYCVVSSSIELTSQEKSCMLRACLNHAKGGHSDHYERQTTYCEGGSSTTSGVRRGCKAALAHEGDARVSRIECVADKTGVRGRVPRQASEHQSTGFTNRINEANLFGLPVAAMRKLKVSQATSNRIVVSATFCHFILPKGQESRQGVDGRANY